MATLHIHWNVTFSTRHHSSAQHPTPDTWRSHVSFVGCNKHHHHHHHFINTTNLVAFVPHNTTVVPRCCCPSLSPRNSTTLSSSSSLIVKWWWKMEEMKVSRRVEWWHNMIYPVRRVCLRVATRFRLRKNGLLKLRHDVRACEYEDIQVMWEILNRNESEFGNSSTKFNKKWQCWKLLRWARCAPYMCRA